MELGNLFFGNSRGRFSVDRNLQDKFHEGLESMGFDGRGNKEGYEEGVFENEVFRMQPYYWGECECGHDVCKSNFSDTISHSKDCYQTEYRKIYKKYGREWDKKEEDKLSIHLIKSLCEKYGFSFPSGCAVHCSCDYNDKWDDWASENDHAEDCFTVTPNFSYKPMDFHLSWYKYPLRDSYSNIALDEILLDKIMKACKKSLGD